MDLARNALTLQIRIRELRMQRSNCPNVEILTPQMQGRVNSRPSRVYYSIRKLSRSENGNGQLLPIVKRNIIRALLDFCMLRNDH